LIKLEPENECLTVFITDLTQYMSRILGNEKYQDLYERSNACEEISFFLYISLSDFWFI